MNSDELDQASHTTFTVPIRQTDMRKQCRLKSDTTEHSALFATDPLFCTHKQLIKWTFKLLDKYDKEL